MKARLLQITIVTACLLASAGRGALGQHQGPPPLPPGGVPPGGAPPAGFPGGGAPPSGTTPGNGPGTGTWPNAQGRPDGHSLPGPGTHGSDSKSHSSLQLGPVGRWWDDRTVVQSIGLRREQQRQMDTIFNASKPAIVSSYKTFLSEQAKLNALNKDPNVDQARLFSTIDEVNQARAALQKATAQMLLAIRKQMSPDQIEKLEKLP